MNIPKFIQRVLMVNGLIVFVVWCYLTLVTDWRVGAAFLGAGLWAMSNLVAWSLLIITATSSVPAKRAKVLSFIALKLAILIGGPILLVIFRPSTVAQLFAVLAGISSVVVITLLKAIGAWLTGTDIFEGRTKVPLFVRRARIQQK